MFTRGKSRAARIVPHLFVVVLVVFLSFFNFILPAQAQCEAGAGSVNLGECLRLNDDQGVGEVYESPAFLVNLIVRNLFVAGAVILFLLVFYAGFLFVFKGKAGVEDAKSVATNAIIGFVVMFSAYWIVQIIAVITGTNIQL